MTGDYRPVSKASSADASQVLWESAKEKDAAQRGGGGREEKGGLVLRAVHQNWGFLGKWVFSGLRDGQEEQSPQRRRYVTRGERVAQEGGKGDGSGAAVHTSLGNEAQPAAGATAEARPQRPFEGGERLQ